MGFSSRPMPLLGLATAAMLSAASAPREVRYRPDRAEPKREQEPESKDTNTMAAKPDPDYMQLIADAIGGNDKLAFACRNGVRVTVSTIVALMNRAAILADKANEQTFAAVKSLMLVATKRHENSADALDAMGAVLAAYGDTIRNAGGGDLLDTALARIAVAQAAPDMADVPGYLPSATPDSEPPSAIKSA